jgi:hypothetical protein
MKRENDINRPFQKVNADSNPRVDKVVLEQVLTAYKDALASKSARAEPSIWRTIMRSRITKLAVSAAMIIAVLVGVIWWLPSSEGVSPAADESRQVLATNGEKAVMEAPDGEQAELPPGVTIDPNLYPGEAP